MKKEFTFRVMRIEKGTIETVIIPNHVKTLNILDIYGDDSLAEILRECIKGKLILEKPTRTLKGLILIDPTKTYGITNSDWNHPKPIASFSAGYLKKLIDAINNLHFLPEQVDIVPSDNEYLASIPLIDGYKFILSPLEDEPDPDDYEPQFNEDDDFDDSDEEDYYE